MNGARIVFLVVALTTLCLTSLAASEPEDGRKRQLRLWQSYYQEEANSYDFRLQSKSSQSLLVSPQPIHFYLKFLLKF